MFSTPFFLKSAANQHLRLTGALLGASFLSLAACQKDGDTSTPSGVGTVLYVENNLTSNGVMAYHQEADGSLKEMTGSPFATGGSGFINTAQSLGPNDTDEPLVLSADKKRLYAVNQGSNTIAGFDIQADGTLKALAGSPFPSGGNNPCSVGIANSRLYVVNKSDDANPATIDPAPNYTVFNIEASGQLTPLAGSTITTKVGASPAHAYVAPNQRLLFVDDFLAFMPPNPTGTLRAFAIGSDGKLTAAPGTPVTLPLDANGMMSGALGLWSHPTQNVLYVGIPMQNRIAVYNYDGTTGALTYRTSIDAGIPGVPNAAVCWLRTNKAGTRLYSLNSGESSVSVFDLANPLAPSLTQTLVLKNAGPVFGAGGTATSSQPFHLAFSPDEQSLFVVSQHTNPDYSTNYNYLHTLSVGSDGKLSEPTTPLQPAVPATARPQGAVSVTL